MSFDRNNNFLEYFENNSKLSTRRLDKRFNNLIYDLTSTEINGYHPYKSFIVHNLFRVCFNGHSHCNPAMAMFKNWRK